MLKISIKSTVSAPFLYTHPFPTTIFSKLKFFYLTKIIVMYQSIYTDTNTVRRLWSNFSGFLGQLHCSLISQQNFGWLLYYIYIYIYVQNFGRFKYLSFKLNCLLRLYYKKDRWFKIFNGRIVLVHRKTFTLDKN